MQEYLEMLKFKRPEGSKAQSEFCSKFLEPVFGIPDRFGNYKLEIGKSPLVFTAHHDTVHWNGGYQETEIFAIGRDVYVKRKQDGILGADCTSGIWLILKMIKEKVPGNYLIFSGEELGCVGSNTFVSHNQNWIKGKRLCVSFDRRGYRDVITHQLGERTCSDFVARTLARILNNHSDYFSYRPEEGLFTDSVSFHPLIRNCTNISVGYENEHSDYEFQDLSFLNQLSDALIYADWQNLIENL